MILMNNNLSTPDLTHFIGSNFLVVLEEFFLKSMVLDVYISYFSFFFYKYLVLNV